jgi:chromosome segregation ATPase
MAASDGNQPATKADLEAVCTMLKDDIQAVRIELKGDIQAVSTELKDDIQAVRTELKGDIQAVSTELKGDIQAVSTELKDDIQAVRTELKSVDQKADRIALELAKTQGRMERMEDKILGEMRAFRSELLKAYEGSVAAGKKYHDKALTHGAILSAHEEKLADHDRRIAAVETRR